MAIYNIATQLVIQGVDTASVQKAIASVNSQMSKGVTQAKTFADAVALRGVNLAGYTIIGAAMVKITEAISRATNDAIRFEYELAKIAQTVQKSNAEVNKHASSIREISVAYGLSAPKIAETIRVLAQAGYSFKEAKASADSLAQTTLLASFESIADTTDGLIAINKQFIETMGDSQRVLSVLNTVSKKYAVESSDLVEAVRKAGGTFAATGGKMEELVAIFTTVRDTTRESSETIATGLRTIFSRLQRPKTIDFLKQYGIALTDLKGNFIGNYEAIQAIQEGLDKAGVKAGSIKFAGVVEEIGGIRQQSRVIPLLTQAAKMQKIFADTQASAADTALDLAKAQDTLSFKLSQTQQNFAKLIGDIASTEKFKQLTSVMLGLANAVINFASSLKDLIPLITTLLAFKLSVSFGKLLSKSPAAAILGAGAGKGFASGGFVPGSGSGDTVPAMLTPGEFVINKSSAQSIGYGALHRANKYAKGGIVQHFADGGQVGLGPGTEGLGLNTLILGLDTLGPKLTSLAGAFTGLMIQLSFASQVGKGLANSFQNIRKASQDQAKAQAELAIKIAEQQTVYDDSVTTLRSAQSTLISAESALATSRTRSPSVSPSGLATISARSVAAAGSTPNVLSLSNSGKLNSVIGTLTTRYGKNAEVMNEVISIQAALKGNISAQVIALTRFNRELSRTTLPYEEMQKAAQSNADALEKVTEEHNKTLVDLKKGRGGRLGRIGGKVAGALGEAGPAIAATALTAFVSNLNSASQAAASLADKAIQAGNAQEAYDKSLEASAKAESASGLQTGASAGAALGSLIAPLLGPFAALGPIVGTAVGALIGWSGLLTKITDLFSFTSSAMEAENKARADQLAANVAGNSTIAEKALKSDQELRKKDPSLANKNLSSNVNTFVTDLKTRGLGEWNKETGGNIKNTFSTLTTAIEELAKQPENAGQSFDQLRANSDGLIDSLIGISATFTNGAVQLEEFKNAVNATAATVNKETAARLNAIDAQFEQIRLSNALSDGLSKLTDVTRSQSNTLSSFSFNNTGELSRKSTSDLTNTESSNLKSTSFAGALSRVADLSPEFKTQTAVYKKSIDAFDDGFKKLLATRAETNPTSSNAQEMDRFISEAIKNSGLDPSIQGNIQGDIDKALAEGQNPLQTVEDIFSKYVKPTGEIIQAANKSIEDALTQQIDINNAIVASEKSKLDATIKSAQDQSKIQKGLRDLVSGQFDKGLVNLNEFSTANSNRIGTGKQALAGTSLEKAVLTGKKEDLLSIYRKLRANKVEQSAIKDNLDIVDKGTEEYQKLIESQKSLKLESDRFEVALSVLSDTTEETAALQNKLSESLERRNKIKDAASSFVFGSTQSRLEQSKTANQAAIVARTGSAQNIPGEDRAAVVSFLENFKTIQLPGLGGRTGGEVLNKALANDLRRMGASSVFVEDYLAEISKEEADLIKQIEGTAQLDTIRNDYLKDIKDVLDSMNARGVSLPELAQGNANGGLIKYASRGMFVPKGTDTVPAMLTPGEFVIKKSAVQSIGLANLQALNNGTNYLARGGLAEKRARAEADIESSNTKMRLQYGKNNPRLIAALERKKAAAQRRLAAYDKQEEKADYRRSRREAGRDRSLKSRSGSRLAPTGDINASPAITYTPNTAGYLTVRSNAELGRGNAGSSSYPKYGEPGFGQPEIKPVAANKPSSSAAYDPSIFLKKKGDEALVNEIFKKSQESIKSSTGKMIFGKDIQTSANIAKKAEADKLNSILGGLRDPETAAQIRGRGQAAKELKGTTFQTMTNSLFNAIEAPSTLLSTSKRRENMQIKKDSGTNADTRLNQLENTAAMKYIPGFIPAIREMSKLRYKPGEVPFTPKPNEEVQVKREPSIFEVGPTPKNFMNGIVDVLGKATTKPLRPRSYSSNFEKKLIRGYATGGPVGTDTVPAMLTPGEFVLRKSAAQAIGPARLNAVNRGQTKYFADGGSVGSSSDNVGLSVSQLEMFNKQFNDSVQKLVDMPKTFEISLASQGIAVNLNGTEFLSKLPDLMRSMILDRIREEIGNISDAVKKNLSAGR
jgi:TP901 family phage tail tape measure protein